VGKLFVSEKSLPCFAHVKTYVKDTFSRSLINFINPVSFHISSTYLNQVNIFIWSLRKAQSHFGKLFLGYENFLPQNSFYTDTQESLKSESSIS